MAALVGLLIVFGLVLSDSQTKGRDDVEGRFADRAKASAELTGSLFGSASSSAQAERARKFGGARVSTQALAAEVKQTNGLYLMVLSQRGEILGASPGTPADAKRTVAAQPDYIRRPLKGAPFALSNMLDAGSKAPSMVYAQSFKTGFGLRVLVSGLDARLISGFLAGSLKKLPNVEGGRPYVLDEKGVIVASPSRAARTGTVVGEPGLLQAAADRAHGSFSGGRYFASERVPGTPWRVVLTAPEDELFASVSGSRKIVPWALLVAFGLAAAMALVLLRRSLRSGAELAAANDRLGVANRTLGRRAGELARSNEQLERFASIASHDLQEPLRKVRTFAERLERQEGDRISDTGRDYLTRMTDAAQRMQDLIDDLLAFSRITTQRKRIEHVELTDVAREVVADLEAVVHDADATVHVGELPGLAADPLRMRQLLQNLVSNAIKFRRDGVPSVVHIDGRVVGEEAEIVVRDNGIGFEQRYAGRIFRVFERLHGRDAYPGTGIGLALCRRIAESHGGDIVAESRPGEGSRFIVTLPLEQIDDLAAPAPPEHSDERPLATV